MAAAKKDYEATLKKPKQSGVKVSAGDRQEDSAHAALLTLQAELRTLEKHAGANDKISQQRRDLWKAESQFAVLEEVAQRRQLSAQEKSLLAHKDETLEYKRQLAALGDKVTYQERLNALAQQADKFAQQQRAKRAAIDAKSRGLTDRQAEREATEQRLKEQYGDNPLALNNVMSEQKKTWAAEDLLRGNWMAGLRSGWSEWKGAGGKYEPAGIVHRGEFVFTKEATSRIGVGNLYRLMRGYATGGYVGAPGSRRRAGGRPGLLSQNNHVVINNDGTNGQIGPAALKAVYDMGKKRQRTLCRQQAVMVVG